MNAKSQSIQDNLRILLYLYSKIEMAQIAQYQNIKLQSLENIRTQNPFLVKKQYQMLQNIFKKTKSNLKKSSSEQQSIFSFSKCKNRTKAKAILLKPPTRLKREDLLTINIKHNNQDQIINLKSRLPKICSLPYLEQQKISSNPLKSQKVKLHHIFNSVKIQRRNTESYNEKAIENSQYENYKRKKGVTISKTPKSQFDDEPKIQQLISQNKIQNKYISVNRNNDKIKQLKAGHLKIKVKTQEIFDIDISPW